MTVYTAPAKLNLSLLVSPPARNGYHPLDSLVQTIQWCDSLSVDQGEGSDSLEVEGSGPVEDNLVMRAVTILREWGDVPPLAFELTKEIPMGAGLGGGSSDAAAALVAAADAAALPDDAVAAAATRVGADVALFLRGGSQLMRGFGEELHEVAPLTGFAVAVVMPEFPLATADVYRRWDELEGPEGWEIPDPELPPTLRGRMPMRNDLLPAALDLQPLLGDFIADVRSVWGAPVAMTGSGSACFGYFTTIDEAADAARSVAHLGTVARGVDLRDRGVSRAS